MYVVYKDSETRTTFATKRMLKATEFCMIISNEIAKKTAQVRKSVDSPPGMLTEDHHHTVHEERHEDSLRTG